MNRFLPERSNPNFKFRNCGESENPDFENFRLSCEPTYLLSSHTFVTGKGDKKLGGTN